MKHEFRGDFNRVTPVQGRIGMQHLWLGTVEKKRKSNRMKQEAIFQVDGLENDYNVSMFTVSGVNDFFYSLFILVAPKKSSLKLYLPI